MLKWLRARTEARNAEQLEVARRRIQLFKVSDDALLAKIAQLERKLDSYKEEAHGRHRDMQQLRHDGTRWKEKYELEQRKLASAKSLIDQLRLMAAFALEAVHEKDVTYKRAESHGTEAESESIGLAMDAVNGLRLAQRVASARFDVMRSRIRSLEAQLDADPQVEMDIELEDTRPSKPPPKK